MEKNVLLSGLSEEKYVTKILLNNYDYFHGNNTSYSCSLRADYLLPKNKTVYLKIEGEYVSWSKSLRNYQCSLSAGIVF